MRHPLLAGLHATQPGLLLSLYGAAGLSAGGRPGDKIAYRDAADGSLAGDGALAGSRRGSICVARGDHGSDRGGYCQAAVELPETLGSVTSTDRMTKKQVEP